MSLYLAKLDSFAARAKAIAPRFDGPYGASPHARGDAALETAAGLADLSLHLADFLRAVIADADAAIGALPRDALSDMEALLADALADPAGHFKTFADRVHHETVE